MKILLEDKDEIRKGYGALGFNATINIKLFPLEIVLLPYFISTKYKSETNPAYKFHISFRWLIFFVIIFKR